MIGSFCFLLFFLLFCFLLFCFLRLYQTMICQSGFDMIRDHIVTHLLEHEVAVAGNTFLGKSTTATSPVSPSKSGSCTFAAAIIFFITADLLHPENVKYRSPLLSSRYKECHGPQAVSGQPYSTYPPRISDGMKGKYCLLQQPVLQGNC